MEKKVKFSNVLLSYTLIFSLVIGAFSTTAFAKDSTTEATKPTKKTVSMTEVTKPQKQTTMQVTDVKTKKTQEIDIEKEEQKEEQKPTIIPTTQQTPEEASRQKETSAENCDGKHANWIELANKNNGGTTDTTIVSNTLQNGQYFLGTDVTITKNILIKGTVKLCLNGKTLQLETSEDSAVIEVTDGAELILCDCKENTEKKGIITGGTKSGIYIKQGSLTMNAGQITNNKGLNGGGVFVNENDTFTMNGGNIIDNTASTESATGGAGGGVYVNGGTFDMKGGTIFGNRALGDNKTSEYAGAFGGGVCVVSQGTFTMSNDSIIQSNHSNLTGGGVYIKDSTFLMNNGTISENSTGNSGGGVYIYNSEFTMKNGSISKNNGQTAGGGVFVDSNTTFTMEGGVIGSTENDSGKKQTALNGGGVYVRESNFNMKNGIISGNEATKNNYNGNGDGGGVYIAMGEFNMSNDSTISNNTAANYGGGVSVNGTFTMTDGTIRNNISKNSGAGVDLNGIFTMTGGKIIENESNYAGGGIYINPSATFKVSNAPVIADNKGTSEKSTNNVYIPQYNVIISVIDKLEQTANIGVTIGNDTKLPKEIATGNDDYTILSGDESKFTSDNPNYKTVFHSDDNKVYLERRSENEKIVTFDYQCDTIRNITKYVEANTSIETPNIPERKGYILVGWFIDKDCTDGKEWDFANDTVTKDITLYAKWIQNETPTPPEEKFTVTFDSQGGSSVSSQEVEKDKQATKPTNPTKTGYTFDGWYKEQGCTTAWDFANDTVTKDITLYAKWIQNETPTPPEEKYIVTFDSQGGSSVPSQEVEKDKQATKPTNPTKTGYTFDGWYKEQGCTTAWNFATDAVTENITLYAKWTEETAVDPILPTTKFTVTFDSQGGSSVSPQEVEKDKQATKPTNPTKNGFIFNGWCTDKECTQIYNFNTSVTKSFTLYAKWEENKTTPSKPTLPTTKYYIVTFESNGGSKIPSQTIETGKTAVMPENPTKSDCEFLGWFADENFNEVYRFSTPVTKDITIYAKWKSDDRIVIFETNGGSEIPSQTIETGKTAVMPENPTKSGYEFLGWFADKNFNEIYRFNTPVTEDITIYAKWKSTSRSSGGGGSSSSGRTGTWVTEEPKTIQTTIQPVIPYETVKQGCLRDETCPLWKFTDVDKWAWYHDGSHYCVEHGLIVGTTNTTFSPDMPITRAMIVTILWRTENKPLVNDVIPFQDIKETAYYAEAVRWAAHNGIISGYSSTIFAPDESITREQMASILYRYTQYKNRDVSGKADISTYQDRNEISNYALAAIQWACDVGVINGINTTTLSPKGTTTRAQAAQMFKAYLE